jgi:PAS domain S-box-containing protein
MLFNNATEGILVVDNETKKFLFANPALCKMLGYTREELLSLSLLDIHPKESHDFVLSEFKAQERGEKNIAQNIPCLKKKGNIIFIEISSSSVIFDNRKCTMGFISDITEKKKAEEEIKSLSKFPSENPNPVMRINKNNILLYANNAALSQLSSWKLQVGNMIPDILKELTKDSFKSDKIQEVEITYEDCVFAFSASCSKAIGYVNLYARDITSRKQTEKILIESEKKYRNLIESISDWVWITDQNGLFLYSSSKVKDILGYEVTEIIGKNVFDLMPKDESNRFFKIFNNFVKMKTSFFRQEVKNIHKNGTVKILEKSATPFFNKKGLLSGYRGIDRDVTEQKNLEQQLFHAQKMESVGLLAGGIAHDFNNLLMAIMSYSKIIELNLEKESPLKEYINEITDVCKKATNLTQNLLAFSRKQIIDLKPIKLNKLITDIKKTLIHIIREDIELKTILYNQEINVLADNNAINQVLLNLVNNASDAMPNGGYLEIKTEIVDLQKDFIKAHGFGKPGKFALIYVSDTGVGMDKSIYEKIFDPFFTTKDVGKGTGLGLSVSYGIIKQHNGFINVYSEKGVGTTFRIYLPLIYKKLKSKKKEVDDFHLIKGDETILIVEDEKEVRDSLKIILENIGYNIITAIDGEDAINKFKKNIKKINLIILDIIIPKLNGKIVYDRIKDISSNTKFIFMSGYTAETIKGKDISDKEINFISKPISPDILLKKIKEVLEK